ncbi:MAG: helix-turn-helix domain-containing protein, partial [Azonexus sp.]|nr:helix-turn-helix domain-containing protein [Azonexus sp.]
MTADERVELGKLVASKLTSVRLSQRAHLVLLAADGMQNREIAARLGLDRMLVGRWRGRFAQLRL